MDVRNCRGCGRLYNYIGGSYRNLCPDCVRKLFNSGMFVPEHCFYGECISTIDKHNFPEIFLPSTPRSQLAVHKVIAICTLAKTNVVVPLPSLSAYRRRSGLCYTAFQHLLIKTKSYRMSRIGSTSKFI